MNLRNYTSGVPVEMTISRIEARLAAAGATGIMKMYNDRKQVYALLFEIQIGQKVFKVRVPANSESCFETMWKDHVAHHSRWREGTKDAIREQAMRTAWRLVQDWIDVQISMIMMKQAEFLEVFMPYLWDGKQTLFAAMKGDGYKLLSEQSGATQNGPTG